MSSLRGKYSDLLFFGGKRKEKIELAGSYVSGDSFSTRVPAFLPAAPRVEGEGFFFSASAILAAGVIFASGAGFLGATSSATGTGSTTLSGYAELTALTTLSGVGTASVAGVGVVEGVSGITATGVLTFQGAASVAGVSSVVGAGTVIAAPVVGIVDGAGDAAGASTVEAAGTVMLVGSGDLAAASTVEAAGAVMLVGSGNVAAASTVEAAGAVMLAGSGNVAGASTVEAAGTTVLVGSGTMAGVSTVEAAGATMLVGSGDVAGVSGITADGEIGADVFFGIEGGLSRYDTRSLSGYAEDDLVDLYLDSGGADNHGEASGAARAKYTSDAGGSGKPGLVFEGGQHYTLPEALKLPSSQAYTVYMVGARTEDLIVTAMSWTTRGTGGRGYELRAANLQRASMTVGGSVNGFTDGWPVSSRKVARYSNNTTNFFCHYDGTLQLTGTSSATTVDMSEAIASIGSRNGIDTFWQGYIQDIVVYLGHHDAETAGIVEAGMAAEWFDSFADGTATLDATSGIEGTGSVVISSEASLEAGSGIVSDGSTLLSVGANLEAVSGLVASGTVLYGGDSTLTATSSITGDGTLLMGGSSSLDAVSGIVGDGTIITAPAGPEDVIPSSITSLTNLTGAVTDIQDDPDSPDGLWLTAAEAANTEAVVAMGTPTLTPAGTQTLKVLVRRNAAAGNDPNVSISVNGTIVLASTALTAETVFTTTFDASIIGAGVSVTVEGSRSGGPVASRRTVEVGAIRWIASE